MENRLMNHAIYFKGVNAVTKEKGCFPLLLRDLQKCDSTICEEIDVPQPQNHQLVCCQCPKLLTKKKFRLTASKQKCLRLKLKEKPSAEEFHNRNNLPSLPSQIWPGF
jgi:hypothetical protein